MLIYLILATTALPVLGEAICILTNHKGTRINLFLVEIGILFAWIIILFAWIILLSFNLSFNLVFNIRIP